MDGDPIRYNDTRTISLDPNPPMDEVSVAMRSEMLRLRRLMEQNPHPYLISVPNPAWRRWMDEHSKEHQT